MTKPLNFNMVKKKYLTVTLTDEKKTTLMIGTPTKAIMDNIMLLQESFEEIEADNAELDSLYEVCSKIMSRNKGGIAVTKEFLETIFDFEDIMIFFNAYMDFIDEVMGEKN